MTALTRGATAPAAGGDTAAEATPDQRTRILHAALRLMGEHGAHVTSMRQLAAACSLNVATLYHYFPSKADLLRAVIEDRHYFDRLATEPPPIDPDAPPRQRLAAVLSWVGRGALEEEDTWRLLLGEGLRNEQVALDTVSRLSDALEATYARWLRDHFPELTAEPDAAARVLRGHVFAMCIEALPLPETRRAGHIAARSDDLAALVFPDSRSGTDRSSS